MACGNCGRAAQGTEEPTQPPAHGNGDEQRIPSPRHRHRGCDSVANGDDGDGGKRILGQWSVRVDRVHIEGTKRAGRVRDVPLIRAPAVPRIHRRTFGDKLHERTRDFTTYDLRRTYATWLEDAGIPRTRRRMYLGHGERDVTDLYEARDVADFLEAAPPARNWLTTTGSQAGQGRIVRPSQRATS